jgi:hypothetical protein
MNIENSLCRLQRNEPTTQELIALGKDPFVGLCVDGREQTRLEDETDEERQIANGLWDDDSVKMINQIQKQAYKDKEAYSKKRRKLLDRKAKSKKEKKLRADSEAERREIANAQYGGTIETRMLYVKTMLKRETTIQFQTMENNDRFLIETEEDKQFGHYLYLKRTIEQNRLEFQEAVHKFCGEAACRICRCCIGNPDCMRNDHGPVLYPSSL